jgi:hypothetical protein
MQVGNGGEDLVRARSEGERATRLLTSGQILLRRRLKGRELVDSGQDGLDGECDWISRSMRHRTEECRC